MMRRRMEGDEEGMRWGGGRRKIDKRAWCSYLLINSNIAFTSALPTIA